MHVHSKSSIDTYVFGTCAWTVISQQTLIFMVELDEIYPVRLQHAFGIVPVGGYGKCSSFVCTDPEHRSEAGVSWLLKLK